MKIIIGLLWLLFSTMLSAEAARKLTSTQSVRVNTQGVCARLSEGSQVLPPPEQVSKDGFLNVTLSFQSSLDAYGNPKFCYVLPTGEHSPLMRVWHGDTLFMRLRNDAGANPPVLVPHQVVCNNVPKPLKDATNVHFHGMNVSPMCPEDNVLHVTINPGDEFLYQVDVNPNVAPGLYWYHPHQHGLAAAQVQGGASGPLIVEGIENLQPLVGGLREEVLVVRDILKPSTNPDPDAPAWDVSVNNVPVRFKSHGGYKPAVLAAKPGERIFCRFVNAVANTELDVAVISDGKPVTIGLVALDGYVLRTKSGGKVQPLVRYVDHVVLPPAARVEFILVIPKVTKNKNMQLVSRYYNTGEDGDFDPKRPLVTFDVSSDAQHTSRNMPAATKVQALKPVISTTQPKKTRTLYFSENNHESKFYITEVGATPTLFFDNEPPAIKVRQGTVEDWIIENRSLETHVFHLHQVHFTLLERNGKPVKKHERQGLDTVNVGFWNNKGAYPSIKIRVDFRGADVGKFVYHCHILEHEDHGMMAIVQVI